jgi:hypothetical protein
VYLGGFHNRVRREWIRRIFSQNSAVEYHHFGDIDAGGFYILQHLRERTGVSFRPWQMDVVTLKKYREFWLPLTASDRTRLKRLTEQIESNFQGDREDRQSLIDVIRYMLKNDCKMEQEATHL